MVEILVLVAVVVVVAAPLLALDAGVGSDAVADGVAVVVAVPPAL